MRNKSHHINNNVVININSNVWKGSAQQYGHVILLFWKDA
jgi:hypothetical protein